MRRLSPECRSARRNIVRRNDLSAANRGYLDLHLRRCEACRTIYECYQDIETGPGEILELDEQSKQSIYNGLLPVINEITSDSVINKPRRKYPSVPVTWGFGVAVAAAACAVLVMTLFFGETPSESIEPRELGPIDTSREVVLSSLVDRLEGSIAINGETVTDKERFKVKKGTYIEVDKNARFSFHIGDLARIAMFGDTKWELTALTDKYVAINLDQGRIAIDFDGSMGKSMEITTPDSIVRVKGTIFTVEVLEDGATEVGVLEGLVEVVSRYGNNETIEVGKNQLGTVPGDGELIALNDRHRSLAAEMLVMQYPEELTRVVTFDGSPERVRVEVDGRVLGTTPLAVRLPDAPFAYRLTSPGMEPVEGTVVSKKHDGKINFLLIPEEEFESIPDEVVHEEVKKTSSKKTRASKKTLKKRDWDLLKRARAAMRAGDLPYAIGLLERAIKTVNGDRLVGVLSLLAESYAAAGMYRKATDTYDNLIDRANASTASQNARYEVGRLSMDQLGDLPRARAAFTAYVASPLGGALREEAYYSLCEIDGREGSHRDALHCFDQFLRHFPDGVYEPEARLWRGALNQDMRKSWKSAEPDLLHFLREKPHHPRADEARYRVVIGRYQTGDRAGTLRMIGEYLHKHPNGQYRIRVERIRTAVNDSNFTLKPH